MPVVSDVFDAAALVEAVVAFAPDLVMHQLTNLPDHLDQIPDYAPHNNRIRTEGTRNLLTGTAAAGARRFLAQSIAWTPPGSGTANADHERLVPRASCLVPRASCLVPRASCLVPRASCCEDPRRLRRGAPRHHLRGVLIRGSDAYRAHALRRCS
jgi:hypothetical protein